MEVGLERKSGFKAPISSDIIPPALNVRLAGHKATKGHLLTLSKREQDTLAFS